MNCAELIDEARDFHGSFTKQNIPDVPCMRALSRHVRRIAQQVTQVEESALAVQETVSNADLLAAVTGRAGITLPAHILLLQPIHAVRTEDGYRQPVDLVEPRAGEAEDFPCASLLGGKLYPLNLQDVLGQTYGEHGWEDYDGLELLLVPLLDDLTGPASVIGLPDVSRDALVHGLALFMAGRSKEALAALPLLPKHAADAEAACINTLAGQASTSNWRVK